MSAARPIAAAAAPTAIAPTLANLMVMAQDFATAWSRISSKVDQDGNRLAAAEKCKKALRAALEQALSQADVSPDCARLDKLSAAGGFVHGLSDGAPAFRIFSSDSWYPTLRAAIDDLKVEAAPTEKAHTPKCICDACCRSRRPNPAHGAPKPPGHNPVA